MAGLHAGLALVLVRASLAAERFPGVPLGEGWGRLFVTEQVERWLSGTAPWGQADLLAWPDGMAFWPTDPLLQVVALPLTGLLSDTAALTAVTALLLALAGIGPLVLARVLGAGPIAAGAAGVAVQLSPFVLRHGTDLVLESIALGPAALAGAAIAATAKAEHPGAGTWVAVGLAVLACATTSPYFVVYLALVCAVVALAKPTLWRRWLSVALAGGVACALALAPLLLAEGGQHGRMGPGFQEFGFRVAPTEVLLPSGGRAPPRRKPLDGVHEHAARPDRPGAPARRSAVSTAVQRAPGGATLLCVALLGLALPATRRWSLLALLLLLLGPEPWTAASGLIPSLPCGDGPLAALLARLPLTASLGNAGRIVAAFVVLAAVVAARLATRWPLLAPVLIVAAGLEARQRLVGLALPTTSVDVPARILDSVAGATVFFPSGDPPYWHPEVAPKELLFLAGRAGAPVAYDYGRARQPADLHVVTRLSTIANSAIGITALRSAQPLPDDAEAWAAQPFESLVILEDRLQSEQRRALVAWLEEHAELRARSGSWSSWSWPDRF